MRGRFLLAGAILLPAFPAFALDLPARKPGLWEIKMVFEGRSLPPMTTQHCIDASTDKMMNALGGEMSKGMCSKQDVTQSGSTLVVDSVCNIGGATTTTHGVITGDFNSAYTVKTSSKREGGGAVAAAIPAQTNMTIEARWTGACKPDQKPGDMIMANGIKFNVMDMQKKLGGMAVPQPR